MEDEVAPRPQPSVPPEARPKDPISIVLGDPERMSRALDQMLKDHPKLTREQALAYLKAAGG